MKTFTFFIALSIICSYTLTAQWTHADSLKSNIQRPKISDKSWKTPEELFTLESASNNGQQCNIVSDNSGNIYIVASISNTSSSIDILTFKYNAEGILQWGARYNGPENLDDYAHALAVDDHGNVYVTGSCSGPSGGLVTIKYSASGHQLWLNKIDGGGCDIALDKSKNVYVLGGGYDTSYYMRIVKYDSSGSLLWSAHSITGSSYHHFPRALVLDSLGSAYITGWRLHDCCDQAYVSVKYDSNGTYKWARNYGGGFGGPRDISYDLAGSIIVTGGIGGDIDIATVKYDLDGNKLWDNGYSCNAIDDAAKAITIDGHGNTYITGHSCYRAVTIKYNSSGQQQWASQDVGGEDIQVDMSGYVYTLNAGHLAKLNPVGLQLWKTLYDSLGRAEALAITSDGYSYVIGTVNEAITTKCFGSNGVKEWETRFQSSGLVRPDSIAFGSVYLGTSYNRNLFIVNTGSRPLTFDTMYITHADVSVDNLCGEILPGDTCKINITYRPTTYAAMDCNVWILFQENCQYSHFNLSANVVHDPYQSGSWTHIGFEGRSIRDIACGKDAIFAITADGGSVYRSTDHGLDWSMIIPSGGRKVAVSSVGKVFVQVRDSLYHSSNHGISWEVQDLPSIDIIDCIIYASLLGINQSGALFSGIGADVPNPSIMFRSTDDGLSWSDLGNVPVGSITFGGQYIVASGIYYCQWSGWGAGSYYRTDLSTNNGDTWQTMVDWYDGGGGCVSFTPNGTIFLGGDGLHRSTDLGVSWAAASEIVPNNILPVNDETIVISTNDQGMFISTDTGNTWLTFNTGLTNLNVHTLAMDSLGYYAGTDSGVFCTQLSSILRYISRTGWNLSSFPFSDERILKNDIYCHSTSSAFYYHDGYVLSDTLYHGQGYWIKCNGWDTVKTFSGYTSQDTINVSAGWNIIGSICEPVTVNTIQSEPSGIVTSQFFGYNGNTYFESNTIFPWKGYWVKVNQAGKLILSATGKTIASNRIKIVASNEQPPPPPNSEIPNPKSQIPARFALEQNYPNPFNPVTNFQFSISPASGRDQLTILKVYDVLGREVATLVNDVKQPGEYTISWDAMNVPSGIYFYRLTAGRYIETKKLILMK